MEQLKMYLIEQVFLLEEEISILEKEQRKIPEPHKIDLQKYGSIKNLKKRYKNRNTRKILSLIFGPSKEELKKIIYSNEKNKIASKISYLKTKINEYNEAIDSIKGDNLTQELSGSNELTKAILAYSTENNINPKTIIEYLVKVYKSTKETITVESKIKHNIVNFFDNNTKVIYKDNIDTLKLLFEKLFIVILNSQEQEKYQITLEQIITEIQLQSKKIQTTEEKEDLKSKKAALIELQKYITGTEITAATDTLEEFKILLESAGIERTLIDEYLIKMEEKIKDEQEKVLQKETISIIKKHLTDYEIGVLKKATDLENKVSPEYKTIIIRAKQDVISLCRYIDMIELPEEYHATTEILSERVSTLKTLITNLEVSKKPESVFIYHTDKDLVPTILRDIESLDITAYGEILNSLNDLASYEIEDELYCEKDNYKIYVYPLALTRLIYTKIQDKIVILGITSNTTEKNLNNRITFIYLNQIKEIEEKINNEEFLNLQKTYETLVLNTLNLGEPKDIPILRKK